MATSKAVASKMQADQERKWQVQNAVQTLTQAGDIRKDKGMMKDVKAHVNQMQKTIVGSPTRKKY